MIKLGNLVMVLSLMFLVSCSNDAKVTDDTTDVKTKIETKDKNVLADKYYVVSNSESVIKWKASKIVGGHQGRVKATAGKFKVSNGIITEGKLLIDMTTIESTDVEDAEQKAKLDGHLKTADFFEVETFPTASVLIKDATDINNVKVSLTIKEQTVDMVIPFTVKMIGEKAMVSSSFTVDRTKFNVKHNSGKFFDAKKLGDYLIKDEVSLGFQIVGK